jgi:hypothetical protein
MWVSAVITNDPSVASNQERDSFHGFHASPGNDDWYAFFYGDFRDTPHDASGWVMLADETLQQAQPELLTHELKSRTSRSSARWRCSPPGPRERRGGTAGIDPPAFGSLSRIPRRR